MWNGFLLKVLYIKNDIFQVFPQWGIRNLDIMNYLQYTWLLDSQVGARALKQPIVNKEDLETGFINYCKGIHKKLE